MQAVKWMHTVCLGVLAGLVLVSNGVSAQTPPSSGGAQIQGPGQVVVAGTVVLGTTVVVAVVAGEQSATTISEIGCVL